VNAAVAAVVAVVAAGVTVVTLVTVTAHVMVLKPAKSRPMGLLICSVLAWVRPVPWPQWRVLRRWLPCTMKLNSRWPRPLLRLRPNGHLPWWPRRPWWRPLPGR
jgi:hypothetical protein